VPSYNWQTFISEATTVVTATWTDILPTNGGGGIWSIDKAIRESWEKRVLPYAVYELSDPEPAEYGIANEAYAWEFITHYIGHESVTEETLRNKFEELKSAMHLALFTLSQATVLHVRPNWERTNEVEEIAFQKNLPFRAIAARTVLVGGTSFI
jgi:hypothetical protein